MAEQSAFLTAFDEMQKKKGGFNAPAPLESVVDTVGQAPAVQSPFSQQAAAATNSLAAPIDLAAAPAVQAPQGVLSPEEQTRIEGRLAQTNADIVASGEAVPSLGAVPETPNMLKKGFDYLFGAPTAEQAQNTLDTMPTDPDQRARLQATAAGEGVPSDLSKAGSFFFGRPEVEGDPNILGAQTPSVETPKFGLADPTSSTATGEDPFSAPIVTPTATPVADPDQQIRLADPTSSTVGLNSTQAMLQERFGSPTISGIQSAEEGLGLRTDAQGRMVDPNVDRSSFEQASADREARQAARPDFGEAQERAAGTVTDRERRAARGDDMSDADRRDIAKANQRGASAGDVARGNKVAALVGVDLRTGRPLEGAGVDTRTPEQIAIAEARAEGVRLENERKRQIIDKGNQPNATPRDKKISEFEQNAKEGAEAGILKPWEVEAQRKDFYGKPPPFGYSSWVQAGEQRVPPPSAAAIEKLEADPSLAPDFDAKFGEGEAAKILKKKMSFSDSR